jgi:sulfate permease, SulP family
MEQGMAPERQSAWNRYLPFTTWLPRYERAWLQTDLLAGLTVWAVTIPSSMAYAGIAGVPVQYGLYTACVATFIYALLGTSRQMILGPEAAAAAISAATVAPLAGSDPQRFLVLTSALAMMAGALFLVGGLLRFGFIAKLFARPVISAFVVALALFISVEQLGKLFGVPAEGSNAFEKFADVLRQVGEWSWATVAMGLGCLLLLFLVKRLAPRFPIAITVMALSIIVATLFDLGSHGVALVGDIPSGMSSPAWPRVGMHDLVSMLPGCLGFIMVAYSSSYSIAKTCAARHRRDIDPNQEMIAMGASNLGAGLFQGFVAQASLSRTATNEEVGGETPLVMMVNSALVLATLLFLTALFKNLPLAALGAIVIFSVSHLVDLKMFTRLRRAKREDFAFALAALLGVLIFGVMEGIVIGVVLSLIAFVTHASTPHSAVLGVDESGIRFADPRTHAGFEPAAPGLLIFRFDAPFLFSNAEAFADEVRRLVEGADPPVETLIVDCEMMYDMDTTATDVFTQLHGFLDCVGVEVMLARVHAPVLAFMRRDGVVDLVGEGNVFLTNYDAVEEFKRRHARA